VSGAEFGDGQNKIEIYNPQSNKWFAVKRPAFYPAGSVISDNSVKVLPNGNVLTMTGSDGTIGLYNPATNSWKQGATFPTNWTNEMTTAILPDGSVFALSTSYSPFEAYRYVPALDKWEPAGAPPVSLNTSIGEGGPIAQLPDGKLFILGEDSNHRPRTAIYTPPATPTGTGSWKVGPSVPITADTYGADTPMASLPNGNVLFVMHDNASHSDKWYEYAETTNSLITLANVPTPLTTGQSRSDVLRMLVLPTGQVLVTGVGENTAYIFSPDGAPKPDWLPHIDSISRNTSGSYLLTGYQLAGLSEGGVYGDDNSMSTNYPLVQLTAADGEVHFARTYNASTTAVDTGTLVETTYFALPAGLAKGIYKLRVIASGISSQSVTFTV
jgi:WD40 repeat protein